MGPDEKSLETFQEYEIKPVFGIDEETPRRREALLQRLRAGDQVRTKLVIESADLVLAVVRRYRYRQMGSLADRIQEGLLALAEHIGEYDPQREYESFVGFILRQHFLEQSKEFFKMIPQRFQADCTKVNAQLRFGVKPNPVEIAQQLGMAQDRVVRCIELIRSTYDLTDFEESAVEEMTALDPGAMLEREEKKEKENEVLARFTPIEKQAILIKSGNDRVSIKKLAAELHIGHAAAKELLVSIENKIKYVKNPEERIEDFFD